MKLKYFVISISILFFSKYINGQDQSLNNNESAEAEFHTAINPKDPNNIVLVTMRGHMGNSDSYFTVYYTKDGGNTWETSEFNGWHGDQIGTADPVLAFNNNGDLILTHLGYDMTSNDPTIYTLFSESKDKGETWTLKYQYPGVGFTDKPWIAIDNSMNSEFEGNIYAVVADLNVNLLRLDPDYKLSSEIDVFNSDHIPSVVVNNSGDVFVSSIFWKEDPIRMYVNKYSKGGEILDHSTFVTQFPNFTFNNEDISNRFQPNPYLAIDNTNGPYSGRLYMAYTASESIDPKYFDVLLTYSDDDGLTWSTPKPIHSDTRNGIQQFYSSIYVNDRGVLLIDWYDRTNHSPSNLNTDFFLGVSHDGGETFKELQLNSESMDFEKAKDAGFGFGIGDYHQLVATESEAFSFWSDGRTNDGDLNIYYTKVNLDPMHTSIEEQSMLQNQIYISDIYPQPVSDQIQFSVNLLEPTQLKYDIFTIDNRLIQEGKWIHYPSGSNLITIPNKLTNGHYICRVSSINGYFKNQKFLVYK